MKDDLTNVSVFWNDEYIGEANAFNFQKATNKGMPLLMIKGKLQIIRQ